MFQQIPQEIILYSASSGGQTTRSTFIPSVLKDAIYICTLEKKKNSCISKKMFCFLEFSKRKNDSKKHLRADSVSSWAWKQHRH